MPELVFPTLPGLGWSVEKVPIFQTRVQRAASGRELRAADYTYPLWQFNLNFEFLRDKPNIGPLNEQRTLLDFFLRARGAFNTFLLADPDDSTVTGQTLGAGNGVQTQFPLYRQFVSGGFVDRIYAPALVSHVYINGVDPGAGLWSYTLADGVVTFVTAPVDLAAVSADFTYYFRVRFVDDSMTFEKFMYKLWTVKQLSLISVIP